MTYWSLTGRFNREELIVQRYSRRNISRTYVPIAVVVLESVALSLTKQMSRWLNIEHSSLQESSAAMVLLEVAAWTDGSRS